MTGDKDDQSSTKEAQPTPENPRSEADMIQEISGNLFDAPEGSGLIREFFPSFPPSEQAFGLLVCDDLISR